MRETHIEDEWLLIEFVKGKAELIKKMKLDKELENKPAKEFDLEHASDLGKPNWQDAIILRWD
jgi:hypothetical protein